MRYLGTLFPFWLWSYCRVALWLIVAFYLEVGRKVKASSAIATSLLLDEDDTSVEEWLGVEVLGHVHSSKGIREDGGPESLVVDGDDSHSCVGEEGEFPVSEEPQITLVDQSFGNFQSGLGVGLFLGKESTPDAYGLLL